MVCGHYSDTTVCHRTSSIECTQFALKSVQNKIQFDFFADWKIPEKYSDRIIQSMKISLVLILKRHTRLKVFGS